MSNDAQSSAPVPAGKGDPQPLVFFRKQLRKLQNGLARRLGIEPADREDLVSTMLTRQEEDPLSYWLQIVLAIGISTLGLVLDSTGVVIGAMLISPLMTPIVGLGMGLTTGSPFLTLRSTVRCLASIAVIIGLAALLTRLLPFHEMTAEIAGRTAPTLIDLGIASFCALAAGFTTVRQSSDTVAAAAGTAIGIALVPPLCVCGYGVGIANGEVAWGAGLLFTANMCAILFFTVMLFYGIGYNLVDVSRLESECVKVAGRVARLAAALRRAFSTRYGPLLRFALPLALVAAIFVPLSRALTEVAWKVRVQTEVRQVLDEVVDADHAMTTNLVVEHGQVSIRLVVVGSRERAQALQSELRTRVAAIASTVPSVEVNAVPDFATLQHVADSVAKAVPLAPTPTIPDLDTIRQRVDDRLAKWPRGPEAIVRWTLGFEDETVVVEVTHVGTPGGDFLDLLADTLQDSLERPVALRERAVQVGRWTADADSIVAWLPRLTAALQASQVEGIAACVTTGPTTTPHVPPLSAAHAEPPVDAGAQSTPDESLPEPLPIPGAASAQALLDSAGPDVLAAPGPRWSVAVVRGACRKP